ASLPDDRGFDAGCDGIAPNLVEDDSCGHDPRQLIFCGMTFQPPELLLEIRVDVGWFVEDKLTDLEVERDLEHDIPMDVQRYVGHSSSTSTSCSARASISIPA